MFYTTLCLLAAIGALLAAMALHQRFDVLAEDATDNIRTARGIWLGIVSNLLGGSVLAMFIFMKLRRLI
jgi:hypothetical protein